MVIDYPDDAVLTFDQRGTAFHPITAVVIGDGTELSDRWAVDVATEDSVDRKFLCITNDLFLEPTDKTDRVLDSFFRVGAQRPIAETESTAHEIDRRIKREQELVTNVTREREPLHVLHYCIELVPMNYEHPAAIGQAMNGMLLHRDVAIGAVKFGEQIIVIARDIDGPRAFARFPENLLNDIVMLLRPVNPAAQLPDVDQVAHHIKSLKFVLAQKIEQRARVRATRAQMHVRDPHRPNTTDEI